MDMFFFAGGLNVEGEADSWDFGVGMDIDEWTPFFSILFEICYVLLWWKKVNINIKPIEPIQENCKEYTRCALIILNENFHVFI